MPFPGIMPHDNLCVAKSDAMLGNIPTLRQPWFDNWSPFFVSRDEILNETQCVKNSFEVCIQIFFWIHSTAVSRDIFVFFGYTNFGSHFVFIFGYMICVFGNIVFWIHSCFSTWPRSFEARGRHMRQLATRPCRRRPCSYPP